MTNTYRSPDLNAFSDGVTREDMLLAAALMRYAMTPEGKPDEAIVMRVAMITASRGRYEALMWLDGFWYATGVRKHGAIVAIQTILTLEVPA